MSIFKNCKTATKRGDLGEVRAMYEMVKLGYAVCPPLSDSEKYDILVDVGTEIIKVQCKTTIYKSPSGNYAVNLKTTGGNSSSTKIIVRNKSHYDYLFVLTDDDICYFIPEHELGTSTVILNDRMLNYILR